MTRLQLVPEDGSSDPHLAETFARVKKVLLPRPMPTLYRTLGHAPEMLEAWLAMAWPLRSQPIVSRPTRELMIMRASQQTGAAYEWAHHWPMALEHGVREEQLLALSGWRSSGEFTDSERAVLEFTEQIIDGGHIADDSWARVADNFSEQEIVELTLTAAFYANCARVIHALQVEVEQSFSQYMRGFE